MKRGICNCVNHCCFTAFKKEKVCAATGHWIIQHFLARILYMQCKGTPGGGALIL